MLTYKWNVTDNQTCCKAIREKEKSDSNKMFLIFSNDSFSDFTLGIFYQSIVIEPRTRLPVTSMSSIDLEVFLAGHADLSEAFQCVPVFSDIANI